MRQPLPGHATLESELLRQLRTPRSEVASWTEGIAPNSFGRRVRARAGRNMWARSAVAPIGDRDENGHGRLP
jgi:hypothetical protein